MSHWSTTQFHEVSFEDAAMKCQQCGAEAPEKATFCPACGKPVARQVAGGDAPPQPTTGKQAFTSAVTRRAGDDDPDNPIWQGSFSKLAMIGSWVTAGVVTLGAVILGYVAGFDARAWSIELAVVVGLWIILLLRLLYMQLSVHYLLTGQRFIHERGLLWRQQDRIETIDIDDVSVQQGPIARMLGVGSIRITSSDQSTPQFVLAGIEDVRRVAGLIDEARRKERRKRGVHIESI
jgi:membrane protein YdbS with pleckstrin-like domain